MRPPLAALLPPLPPPPASPSMVPSRDQGHDRTSTSRVICRLDDQWICSGLHPRLRLRRTLVACRCALSRVEQSAASLDCRAQHLIPGGEQQGDVILGAEPFADRSGSETT